MTKLLGLTKVESDGADEWEKTKRIFTVSQWHLQDSLCKQDVYAGRNDHECVVSEFQPSFQMSTFVNHFLPSTFLISGC